MSSSTLIDPTTEALISELADAIDDLKKHILATGRDSSPAWIGLNFQIQSTLLKAQPHLANHTLRMMDGNLCELKLGETT